MYSTMVELLSFVVMDHFRIIKLHGWSAQLEHKNFKRFMDCQTSWQENIKHYFLHGYQFSIKKVMYEYFNSTSTNLFLVEL